MTTPLELAGALAAWVGVAGGLCLLGALLYGRAVYDAWLESNVDKRVLFAGFFIGVGGTWFFVGPLVISTLEAS